MRHCYVLRVFTRHGAGGNHLGVVTDISGLSEVVMQEIAADLGFSETIFIDWRQAAMPSVRIFTPSAELGFAGHPLVGAGWVLNVLGPGGVDTVRCPVGEMGVRLEGDRVWVDTGPVRPSGPGTLAPWGAWRSSVTVAMPTTYHLVELGEAAEVAEADTPPVAGCVYLWNRRDDRVKARFFAPDMGVTEDPATGSAAVALASVFVSGGEPRGAVTVEQGDEIGAPSTIHLRWSEAGISIGGAVVKDEVRELAV